MKKIFKKLLISAMVCALALSVNTPLAVSAADYGCVIDNDTNTVYRTCKKGVSTVSFNVNGLKERTKIKNMKSSNSSVAKPFAVTVNGSLYDVGYFDDDYSKRDEFYVATISFQSKKAGTANVSFTVGKQKLSTKFKVLDYVNPLKTVNISGIKNGKSSNLASKVNASNHAYLGLKKNVSNGKLTFAAKPGWTISRVSFHNKTQDITKSVSYYKNKSKATVTVGDLKKSEAYSVIVTCYNAKNKAELSCYYNIN